MNTGDNTIFLMGLKSTLDTHSNVLVIKYILFPQDTTVPPCGKSPGFLDLTSPYNCIVPSVIDGPDFLRLTSYCSHYRYYLLVKMDYVLLDF